MTPRSWNGRPPDWRPARRETPVRQRALAEITRSEEEAIRHAAEEAARKASVEAEEAARKAAAEAEKAALEVTLEAERKTARDARYAARKSRQR
jgi:hypothetical protein